MANLILPPRWRISDRDVTPEASFVRRREFLRQCAVAGSIGIVAPWALRAADGATSLRAISATRNPKFTGEGLTLTNEAIAARYNNFYEFSTSKDRVQKLAGQLVTTPWPVEITGLCEKPMTIDAAELASQFPLEERVYRFRCVEAWSMVVPWTGFPLAKLLAKVQPKPEAKFVRCVSVNRPEQMPGIGRLTEYPWPYTEGLRMDEAMNDLVLVATGIYGHALPNQHGAPLRIIVPWKYGFKGAKSIVKIELVAKQPQTFWETLSAVEYPFESNVDPGVPHPRWSQATERKIDTGDRVPTAKYNGYAEQVAGLYRRGA